MRPHRSRRSAAFRSGSLPAIDDPVSDPEAAIRALIGERIEAIRNKDAAAAIACLADDVVAFELIPPLAQPAEAVRDVAGFAAWLDGFEALAIDVRDLVVEAGEKVGFAHALHHLTGRRIDGMSVDLWLRSTLCVRNGADGWKIAHAHSSVPFRPGAEMKAAVDLKP